MTEKQKLKIVENAEFTVKVIKKYILIPNSMLKRKGWIQVISQKHIWKKSKFDLQTRTAVVNIFIL